LQLTSIGFDQVPFNKITEQEAKVCNNKGGYSIPIAEGTMMNILLILKKNRQYITHHKNQDWKYEPETFELFGKTVGLLVGLLNSCLFLKHYREAIRTFIDPISKIHVDH